MSDFSEVVVVYLDFCDECVRVVAISHFCQCLVLLLFNTATLMCIVVFPCAFHLHFPGKE